VLPRIVLRNFTVAQIEGRDNRDPGFDLGVAVRAYGLRD
jgi:hypothetical protein